MFAEPIDHSTLVRLVEADAIRAAHVVGQKGGWSVLVTHGKRERPLAAQRSRKVRLFRKLETLVGYLKELGLMQFNVDAVNFDSAAGEVRTRPDRSAALKRAHKAAAHETWLRAEVQAALDDPRPALTSKAVEAHFDRRKAALRKRSAKAT
jgi:hypothetical protein